eukprot:m.33491 g.33491  ORF g.33491 m.33491 type:complete len:354 (+) comp31823_c0_seq2:95-1156(+)
MERKLKRLQRKVRGKYRELEPESDVLFLEDPTTHLFVGNGGLECGIGSDDLMEAFSPYGMVKKIEMVKGRSYSFVEMADAGQAANAFEALNGHLLTDLSSHSPQPVISLSYIDHLPKHSSSSSSKETALPPGLHLYLQFITEAEEDLLIELFGEQPLDCETQSLRHRRVHHYGYEFLYGTNDVDVRNPMKRGIPEECLLVISRMMDQNLIRCRPNQLTVNDYEPGQGIPPHVDTHSAFQDSISSLSLNSQTVMEFYHPDGSCFPVLLQPRCLLVMTGESRYVWKHGISPRKSDILDSSVFIPSKSLATSAGPCVLQRQRRISLTFRAIRGKPCECSKTSSLHLKIHLNVFRLS